MKYYSNGKLLITGEYAVLDGALSFALPTKSGQSLDFTANKSALLEWKSYDHENQQWLAIELQIDDSIRVVNSNDAAKAATLVNILGTARTLNPDFLQKGGLVTTALSFPKNWGLGTSSTLINNIADWANIDAFQLLWNSFKGSGYDIACAQNNTPIHYQIVDKKPVVTPVTFQPEFTDQLFFVYLNEKQDSKEGIQHYRALSASKEVLIQDISKLSAEASKCTSLANFELILNQHEDLISETLQIEKVKDTYFKDYWGSVKSLGAWGGDFVLATGNEDSEAYFKSKGFYTVLPYKDMIL